MVKKDFEDFLNKQEESKKEEKKIDWDAHKQEWLDNVDNFYVMIDSFLKDYIDKRKIIPTKEKIELIEDHIGQYTVDKLIFEMGNSKITFTPIGTLLIGAKGRIDMTSSAGTVKFVLVDKNSSGPKVSVKIHIDGEAPKKESEKKKPPIEWGWKIATPPPRIKYIDINEESFFSALMEVVNA